MSGTTTSMMKRLAPPRLRVTAVGARLAPAAGPAGLGAGVRAGANWIGCAGWAGRALAAAEARALQPAAPGAPAFACANGSGCGGCGAPRGRPRPRFRARGRLRLLHLRQAPAIQFVLEIGSDGLKAVLHRPHRLFVEASRAPAPSRPRRASPRLDQRRGGLLGQEKPIGPPVGCVVAPLDEAGGGEFVDQAPERDRGEIERFGQLVLLDALAALQPRQHRPLRARRAEFAGALVGIGPQEPRHVMEREAEFAGGRDGGGSL